MKSGTRIAFVLNKPAREQIIFDRIEAELQRQNPETATLTLQFKNDVSFLQAMIKFKPDVIVTFPFTPRNISSIFYLIKHLTGCTLISYRTEGLFNIEQGEALLQAGQDQYCPRLVDYECFWGATACDAITQVLLEQGKLAGADRARVVGYPRYEFFREVLETEEAGGELATQAPLPACIHNYRRSERLLFVTGFHFADYTDDDIVGAGDLDLESVEDWKILRGALAQFRTEWVEQLYESAKRCPNNLFILKKHPIEVATEAKTGVFPYSCLEELPNTCVLENEVSTMELLGVSGLLLHYGSTVALESFVCRVPSVSVKSDRLFHDVRLNYRALGMPSHLEVEVEEIEAVVERWNNGGIQYEHLQEMDQMLQDVFDIDDIRNYRSAEKFAKLILHHHEPQRIPWWHPRVLRAAASFGRKFLSAGAKDRITHFKSRRRAA